MTFYIWICTTLFVLNFANSYVLVTADVEDIQNIAKQVLSAPVVEDVGKLWRRAKNEFHNAYQRARLRASEDQENYPEREEHREMINTLIQLGRKAGNYLKSIKKLLRKH